MPHATRKACCTCKLALPLERFHRSRSTRDGLDPRCKDCRRAAQARKPQDPQRRRNTALGRLYGITAAEYEAMHTKQGGVCAICKRPEQMTRNGILRNLCVDHCHSTGKVRGLLCASCNFAIGRFLDNPELMHSAADYLLRP